MSQNNPLAHAFKEGNVFHTYVTNAGRPRTYTPAELEAAAAEYMHFCFDTPIAYMTSRYRKLVIDYKVQSASIKGLSLYLGIGKNTLSRYRKDPAYIEVLEHIDHVISLYNYSLAVVGLLDGRGITHPI